MLRKKVALGTMMAVMASAVWFAAPAAVHAAPTLGNPALPDATVGVAYSYQLQGANGVAPYSFQKISTTYPGSEVTLSSSGLLSGTPQSAGTWEFMIRITDSASALGTYGILTFKVNSSSGSTTTGPTLSVSLETGSQGGSVPAGAPNFPMADFKLLATGGTVGISSIQIVSDSANAGSNVSNISLYKNNTEGLGTASSLSNTSGSTRSATITFSSPLTIASGQSVSLNLTGTIANNATGSVRLGIGAVTFSTSNTSLQTTMPVYGNTISITGSNPGTPSVTVTRDGSVAQSITVTQGQAAPLLAFKVAAASADAYIHGFTLGSVTASELSSKVSNVRAGYGSTEVSSTANSNSEHSFTLSAPILVQRDGSQTITFKANILSNATGTFEPKLTGLVVKTASGQTVTVSVPSITTSVTVQSSGNTASQVNEGYVDFVTGTLVSGWGFTSRTNDARSAGTVIITFENTSNTAQAYTLSLTPTNSRADVDAYIKSKYGVATVNIPTGFSGNPSSVLPTNGTYRIKSATYDGHTLVLSDQSKQSFTVGQSTEAPRGVYVKVQDDPTVYWVTSWGGKMPILTEQIFLSYGTKWSDVRIITQEQLDSYGDVLYIKLRGNARVYKLENFVKRYLTPAAATRLNIDPARVVEVNATEFYYYRTGSTIE
jgi:hypothetical protein